VRPGRRLAAARAQDGCDVLAVRAAAAIAARPLLVADADRARAETRQAYDTGARYAALHADAAAQRDLARDLACALEADADALGEAAARARIALALAPPSHWVQVADAWLAGALAAARPDPPGPEPAGDPQEGP